MKESAVIALLLVVFDASPNIGAYISAARALLGVCSQSCKRDETSGGGREGYANQCSAVGTVFGRSLGLQVVRSRPCVLWRGGHRVEWSVCVPSG